MPSVGRNANYNIATNVSSSIPLMSGQTIATFTWQIYLPGGAKSSHIAIR